jgi:mannose-6-phosphate isomerase-like protein (cupin superfamily)
MSEPTRLVWDLCVSSGQSAGGVREQTTFHEANGCPALTQRIVHVAAGGTHRGVASGEDVLFVLAGEGTLDHGGERHPVSPETGIYVRPGEEYALRAADGGTLEVLVVEVPDPAPPAGAERRVTLRVDEADAQQATADREFRLVVTPEAGCGTVTQFVGYIPPGRAPDHYHPYDEVLYVLRGEGVLHVGDMHVPVGEGACIHFSPELVHSLENAGGEPMEVVGVFRPAGSPAEAYYPDGTRATY